MSNKIEYQQIDPKNQRFPYCIVWTPLPLISWLLPFIGHTGICTSEGVIHDFGGPYFIAIDDMSFGQPYKYTRLAIDNKNREYYDTAIERGDEKYRHQMHNLFCNNCHSHVAHCLNLMEYEGKKNYTMVSVWWMCIANSHYVSGWHFVKTYLCLLIIATIIVLVSIFH